MTRCGRWRPLRPRVASDELQINYLVLETSGVSDPLRIIKSLDAKFGLAPFPPGPPVPVPAGPSGASQAACTGPGWTLW